MREDFLHFIWRTRRFDMTDLTTTAGERIEIRHFGQYNRNAGPDFLNGKVKIGETIWAGNIEIHIKSSEWHQHQHQNDPTYENVILHVVLDEDQPVFYKSGRPIACLEMKKRIPQKLLANYQKLMHNERWIPCQHQFFQVSEMTRNLWIDRMLIERLEDKTYWVRASLENNQHNWEKTFYEFLAYNFGLKVNALPFLSLAQSLPMTILAKHKNSLFQLEALLFGQAGMLANHFEESYPKQLQKEYQFLQKKYNLQPMSGINWKMLRMRPANFPTIRIAQFASLIYHSVHLFSKIMETNDLKVIQKLFDVQPSEYWQDHYVFDKKSTPRSKNLGINTIRLLIINTIIPVLFEYGKQKDATKYKDRALQFAEQLPAERNSIIKEWQKLGVKPQSAYQTQGLIQLKNDYCNEFRCMECAIGGAILKE